MLLLLQNRHGLRLISIILLTNFFHGASSDPCRNVNTTNYQALGSSCFYSPPSALSWQLSERECRSQQGHLAVVNSTKTLKVVSDLMDSMTVGDVWIGLSEVILGWTWTGGRALQGSVKVYPWENAREVSTDADRQGNCVSIEGANGFKWKTNGCAQTKGFICQFGLNHPNCSSRQHTVSSSTTCFLFTTGSHSWFRSRSKCELLGGSLAEPESPSDQSLVATEAQSLQGHESMSFWLGLRISEWQWVTGLEAKTTFWEHTQPSRTGSCVHVHTFVFNSLHLWQSSTCSKRLRFVCQREDPEYNNAMRPSVQNGRENRLRDGLVALLIVLLAVLGIILLFMFVYHRRGKALRRDAREQARLSHRSDRTSRSQKAVTKTDYAIFTCDTSAFGDISRKKPSAPPRPAPPLGLGSHSPSGRLPPITLNGSILEQKPDGNGNDRLPNGNGKVPGTPVAGRRPLGSGRGKAPKLNFENSASEKKGRASKYTAEFETENDDDPRNTNWSEAENNNNDEVFFHNINEHEHPVRGHKDSEVPGPRVESNHSPVHSKRKLPPMAFYKTDADSHQRLKPVTSDSLVMESFKADDADSQDFDADSYEALIGRTPRQLQGYAATEGTSQEKEDEDPNRSKYIEDVAKAFDFLVSGEGQDVLTTPKDKPEQGERKLLKRRENIAEPHDTEIKTHSKIPRPLATASDTPKPYRRLPGEGERLGSTSRRSKHENGGQVNEAFTADETLKRKSSVPTKRSSRTDSNETEQRKRENGSEKGKVWTVELDENDNGLTRVGSPVALGQLSPLTNKRDVTKRKGRHDKKTPLRHRDGRLVTEEEKKARKQRHLRRREREHRRKDKESKLKVTATQIEVMERPSEEDVSTDGHLADSFDSEDDFDDIEIGTLKMNPPQKTRTDQGSAHAHYDIETFGSGETMEV